MSRGRRWSALKKKIESLFAEGFDLRIHANVYVTSNKHHVYQSPRHWLLLNGDIIFDFPGQFFRKGPPDAKSYISYLDGEMSTISRLWDQYSAVPSGELLDHIFDDDRWGFTDLLKAADRRLGRNRLLNKFITKPSADPVQLILRRRFDPDEKAHKQTSSR